MRTILSLVCLFGFNSIAGAGSITVSVLDDPTYAFTPGAGSDLGNFANACANTLCAGGPAASEVWGSAQASASYPASFSVPVTLSAQGQLSSVGNAFSNFHYNVSSAGQTFNTVYLSPIVSINFDPEGMTGLALAGIGQYGYNYIAATNTATAVGILGLTVSFAGTSPASFYWDTTTGAMLLTSSSGVSGSISLETSFLPSTGPSPSLVDFEFQNGIVSVSSNALGWVLPGAGNAAGFALSSVGPIAYTFPSIPNVFDSFDQYAGDGGNMNASLSVPEPCSLALAAFSVLGLLLCRVRRQ